MSPQQSTPLDSSESDRTDGNDRAGRVKRLGSGLASDGRIGSIALLAGGALLARAARTVRRSRRRAATQGLLGTALLGVALRQRRSAAAGVGGDAESAGRRGVEKTVSDEAAAARERNDVRTHSGTNPRGVADSFEGDAATEVSGGDVRFTTTADEPRSKPDLDDDVPSDPRYNEDEEGVEIDLSEASLADEASEATGPAPEQSQPAQTEGTEPESSPPEDASHVHADTPDGSDADATGDDSDREESDGDESAA